MNPSEIMGKIEAMLFITDEPLSIKTIAGLLGIDKNEAAGYIGRLRDDLQKNNRGVIITELDGCYRMCANPAYYDTISQLAAAAPKPLTMPLLETLAIIACKQPVCKADIEAIRGVDASHTVNKLLEHGIIEEKGRSPAPGRPILFGTTDKFLTHFGITDLKQFKKLTEKYNDNQLFIL